MAGGIGSRFWPLSKDNYPKQFLDILGTGKSFIRSTYERFSPIIPDENFIVVTNKAYKQLVLGIPAHHPLGLRFSDPKPKGLDDHRHQTEPT